MFNTLTRADTALALKVSTKTIDRMVARGQLKAYKVGKSIRFKPADVERAMKPVKVYRPSSEAGEGLD